MGRKVAEKQIGYAWRCIKPASGGHLKTSLSCAKTRKIVGGRRVDSTNVPGRASLAYFGMILLPFFLGFAPPQQVMTSEWIFLLRPQLFDVSIPTLDVGVHFVLVFV